MPSEFQDLDFDYLEEGIIQTVNEKWNLSNSELDIYLALGFNGSGDSISLNQRNQELVYLNHDNEFEEIFINADLKKFALTVLRIQRFVYLVVELTPASFYAIEFSDDSYDKLLTDLKIIDSKIFETNNSHWVMTLESMKWERDDERKNIPSNGIGT